jgi:radical SAM protein with 4Fe4S-binding SPASM domain
VTPVLSSRLASPDTDLFASHPYREVDYAEIRDRLATDVQEELKRSQPDGRRFDLVGVASYLANPEEHDSEGRDLSYEKLSFSRTELRVADGTPAASRIRYLLYRYRFNHYPRYQLESDFPVVLAIEPTSVCNLRCVMCFQVDERLSRDRHLLGLMTFDVFKRIIDEAAEHELSAIVLASRGEPMLNKNLFRMIRYAKDNGILDVKLNTNATKLTPDRSRELLESGVDTLVFSVDAAVKEDFERIRPGASFDQVVENITTFNEIRAAEHPNSRTRTRTSMVVLDERQDVHAALEFWRQLVDEFGYRWAIPRVGIYEQPLTTEDRPCSLLWERLYIWWDGTVNPCDEDYLSKLKVGKLDDGSSIRQIWTSESMKLYRALHARRAKNRLHPCDRCPGF